jgi:ribonuclease VapC
VAVILDASALLAFFRSETGHELVQEQIGLGARILSVNLAEVMAVLLRSDMPEPVATRLIEGMPVAVVDFDLDLALRCGRLIVQGKKFGLSLGDRACLALAMRSGEAVLTADQVWLKLADVLGVDVRVLR